ncbi:hypothetical protein [Salinibacterium sp. PAMC 21357]|uniref:hypothetical protein n=1 Tax=Salinibacterium sp. PAMC 21357 TaxID=1112215 RepID=UPI001ED93AC0|nr:hypothetical protein [Salinibacterium sp. PAMC 21357]
MDPLVTLIVGLLIGAILGVVIGVLIARLRATAPTGRVDPEVLEARHQAAIAQVTAVEREQQSRLSAELASTTARAGALGEQVARCRISTAKPLTVSGMKRWHSPNENAANRKCCRPSPRCKRRCARCRTKSPSSNRSAAFNTVS